MTSKKPTTISHEEGLERFLNARPERRRAFELAGWYDTIRRALVRARRAAGYTQAELGTLLKREQSEISRLENGLSDRTRLGTIKSYVDACDGTLAIKVWDIHGRVILDQITEIESQHVLHRPSIYLASKEPNILGLKDYTSPKRSSQKTLEMLVEPTPTHARASHRQSSAPPKQQRAVAVG